MVNVILGLVTIGMLIVAVGSAFLASEEKSHRYNLDITDEHEI